MKRLFDGMVQVHYSQVYVVAHPENLPDMEWCFEGQENGLCGASQPGVLFLRPLAPLFKSSAINIPHARLCLRPAGAAATGARISALYRMFLAVVVEHDNTQQSADV